MSDVRARLAEALRQHWIRAAPSGRGCCCGSMEAQLYHLADVLLSLPGIAIVDTNADVQCVAHAIYRAYHSEWRGFIPRSIELRYDRMARAALLAAAESVTK